MVLILKTFQWLSFHTESQSPFVTQKILQNLLTLASLFSCHISSYSSLLCLAPDMWTCLLFLQMAGLASTSDFMLVLSAESDLPQIYVVSSPCFPVFYSNVFCLVKSSLVSYLKLQNSSPQNFYALPCFPPYCLSYLMANSL